MRGLDGPATAQAFDWKITGSGSLLGVVTRADLVTALKVVEENYDRHSTIEAVRATESVEQNLPNVLMRCDNKNVLRDRVESYRHVNLYNLHFDRHVLGPLHFIARDGPLWRFDLSYSLFQTELGGASRLFSVGRYRVGALVKDGAGVSSP